jgi:hypothetical protein
MSVNQKYKVRNKETAPRIKISVTDASVSAAVIPHNPKSSTQVVFVFF